MSVEQTTQLIQLILNSVLMSVACALLLGGLTAHHAAIAHQLQLLTQRGLDGTDSRWRSESALDLSGNPSGNPSGNLRRQLQLAQYRYRLSRYSVLSAYYALLFAIISCFALTIRGMLDWNWLIPFALALFVLGVSTLLVAVGLTLIDFHLSGNPLLDEARRLLSLGRDNSLVRFQRRSRRSSGKERGQRKASFIRSLKQRMRVG